MAQLPGTIHVKRKLVEEPLETLYIEREGFGPNLDEHSARQVYRLVQAIKRPRLSHDSLVDVPNIRPASKAAAKVPSIVTEDTSIDSQPGPAARNANNLQTITAANSSKSKNQKSFQARRVFHLSAPRASSLSRASSTSSLRGLAKRRGRHGTGVAVFTEKRIMRVDQMARVITKNGHGASAMVEDETTNTNRPRKRPSTRSLNHQNSTTALRSSILHTEEEDGDANLKLAAELSQFTLDTVTPMLGTAKPSVVATEPFKKKPMKYQPRPPPPRQAQNPSHLATDSPAQQSMSYGEDISKEDISDEWVYDVYVRDIAQPSTQSADIPLQQNENSSDDKIGVIVIRAEDEEALEEFMSDDSGSDGWRDDDDDSNAEDYYANDYPDELDSDDEWNLGQNSDQEDAMDNYVISDDERD